MLMKRICATIEFLTRRDKRDQNLFPTEVTVLSCLKLLS